jgi:hypothetical protein
MQPPTPQERLTGLRKFLDDFRAELTPFLEAEEAQRQKHPHMSLPWQMVFHRVLTIQGQIDAIGTEVYGAIDVLVKAEKRALEEECERLRQERENVKRTNRLLSEVFEMENRRTRFLRQYGDGDLHTAISTALERGTLHRYFPDRPANNEGDD